MNIHLKRRDFILNCAKLGISSPLIQLLLRCESAVAETTLSHPDTLVLYYTVNGMRSTFESPIAEKSILLPGHKDLTDASQKVVGRSTALANLVQPDGNISQVITKEALAANNLLNGFKTFDHIGIVRGIDWPGHDTQCGDHNPGALTTCSEMVLNTVIGSKFPSEPSIDQIINNKIGKTGTYLLDKNGNSIEIILPITFATSLLTVNNPMWSYYRDSNLDVWNAAQPHLFPNTHYNLLKGIIDSRSSNNTTFSSNITKRSNSFNLIQKQINTLLKNGKKVLSKNDKATLEQHEQLIKLAYSTNTQATPLTCTAYPQTKKWLGETLDPFRNIGDTNMVAALKEQVDIWILTRLCGLSKTLVLNVPESDIAVFGTSADHHYISHGPVSGDNNKEKLVFDSAYMSVFSYLVKRLDETLDVDGRPLLEKTLCVHNNSAGIMPEAGNDKASHHAWNLPIVIASRHSSIKAVGKYLDYRNHALFRGPFKNLEIKLGVQLNRFYLTIAQAMGLSAAQYESIVPPPSGVPKTVGKVMNMQDENRKDQYDNSKLNLPLEGFL